MNLQYKVQVLEQALLDEQERVDRLQAAIVSGDVCGNLGHRYETPDLSLRTRIEKNGWELPRECSRCGYSDSNWTLEDWTLPELVSH